MALVVDNLTVEQEASLRHLVLPSTPVATTLNGTLTLTDTSDSTVYLTGTATGFSVVLPAANLILQGHIFTIYNTSSQNVLVKTNGGATLFTLAQTSIGTLYLLANPTAVGLWSAWQNINDPNVASGILNYKITASTPFGITGGTGAYSIITGFTLTPVAGTYAIWYNAAATSDTNNSRFGCQIFKGGTGIADSIRVFKGQTSSFTTIQSTMTTSQFNGAQACDVRLNSLDSGGINVTDRTLLMIRMGT